MSIYDETQPDMEIATLKADIEKLKADMAKLEFDTNADDARSLRFLLENRNSVNPGHRHFPVPVTLTDGANVTINPSEGSVFYLLAAGNRTILAPTNVLGVANDFRNRQMFALLHEASGADRTLTLTTGSAGAFRFGTDITALTATTSGLVDYMLFMYNAGDSRWDIISYTRGY